MELQAVWRLPMVDLIATAAVSGLVACAWMCSGWFALWYRHPGRCCQMAVQIDALTIKVPSILTGTACSTAANPALAFFFPCR
ncbi:uncharacterized protein BDZ83DRAFT_641946, partial [Colletotrichum acutatum]